MPPLTVERRQNPETTTHEARGHRIALVCDLIEENWTSMDLVATMLEQGLRQSSENVLAFRLCPPMQRRFTGDNSDQPKTFFNADRILNRYWDYPRWLTAQRDQFDLFHIVDHSYSQLVHHLPAERTIVTCHDLDSFRSVLEPEREQRSRVFRAIARYTLKGFQKAARVTCDSIATRNAILDHGLIEPERLRVVTNGVHPSCSPNQDLKADGDAEALIGTPHPHDLLHVGTTISRKRIDVLLQVVARVRCQFPDVRLIRVGGHLTAQQAALARLLKVDDAIIELPHLSREVLASVYRRAKLVLLPSEREGFGLPLAEAMACGTPVIASDLEVLREVGGDAADYCSVGDVRGWAETITRLLAERMTSRESWEHRRRRCIRQASRFTWAEYARKMTDIYSEVLTAEPRL